MQFTPLIQNHATCVFACSELLMKQMVSWGVDVCFMQFWYQYQSSQFNVTFDWDCSPGHRLQVPSCHGWKWFTKWWWGAKGFTRGCSGNVLKLDGMCRFLFNKDNFKWDNENLRLTRTLTHCTTRFCFVFLLCKFWCKRRNIMVREMKQASLELAMILCILRVFPVSSHQNHFWDQTVWTKVGVIEKHGAVDTTSARRDDMRFARGRKRQIWQKDASLFWARNHVTSTWFRICSNQFNSCSLWRQIRAYSMLPPLCSCPCLVSHQFLFWHVICPM